MNLLNFELKNLRIKGFLPSTDTFQRRQSAPYETRTQEPPRV
jgi:hypothetical protein